MIWRGLASAAGPIVSLGLLSGIANLLGLTGSLYMLQVYDRVLASKSQPTLVALTLLAAGLYAFYGVIETVRARMGVRLGAALEESVSRQAFQSNIALRLTNRTDVDVNRDLNLVRQFLTGAGPLTLFDIPWLPVYVVLLFLFHPLLGWLTTIGAIIMLTTVLLSEFMVRRPSRQIAELVNSRQRLSEDIGANAESVVAMGMGDPLYARWSALTDRLLAAQTKAGDQTALFGSATKALRFLLQSTVLGAGAYLVIQGQLSGGFMIGASILAARALAPVDQLVGHWRAFVSARQAWRRFEVVLNTTPAAPERLSLPVPSATLAVNQLAAGLLASRRPIISGISFTLEAGDGLGILGPSGAGKSTLVRALVGALPALSGDVRLDGSELSHYGAAVIGRSVGYLPQSVELFAGSVRENIGRFFPDASDAEVLLAARDAQVHDLIASLDDGYDTQIGHRGSTLSTGMRQRIGLARAMFRRPFLIVLDEPNSNLDSEGDKALTFALSGARERGAIVVVVAHRPSAIAAMNKIVYLHGGHQSAFGPKAEVLNHITAQAVREASPRTAVPAHG